MSITRVDFGVRKVQKLRRVSLDKAILDNLGLDVGDSVRVEFDPQTREVVITGAGTKPPANGNR